MCIFELSQRKYDAFAIWLRQINSVSSKFTVLFFFFCKFLLLSSSSFYYPFTNPKWWNTIQGEAKREFWKKWEPVELNCLNYIYYNYLLTSLADLEYLAKILIYSLLICVFVSQISRTLMTVCLFGYKSWLFDCSEFNQTHKNRFTQRYCHIVQLMLFSPMWSHGVAYK